MTPRSSSSVRASPSARSPPCSAHCASSRSWWASARPIALRSAASAGSARRRSTACSCSSSSASSGRAAKHPGERRALVAVHVLGQERVHEPAAARHRAAVRLLEAGEDREQRRLASAVRAEHADAHAVGELEVEPVEDQTAAERLLDVARGEERDTCHGGRVRSQHGTRCARGARVRSRHRGGRNRGRWPNRRRWSRPTLSSGWIRTRIRCPTRSRTLSAGCSCRRRAWRAGSARVDRERVWTSAAGAYGLPVAEHALALMLAGARRLADCARADTWTEPPARPLDGSTVAIVGAGGIGRALIRLLAPLDVEVLAVTRRGRDGTLPASRLPRGAAGRPPRRDRRTGDGRTRVTSSAPPSSRRCATTRGS